MTPTLGRTSLAMSLLVLVISACQGGSTRQSIGGQSTGPIHPHPGRVIRWPRR